MKINSFEYLDLRQRFPTSDKNPTFVERKRNW